MSQNILCVYQSQIVQITAVISLSLVWVDSEHGLMLTNYQERDYRDIGRDFLPTPQGSLCLPFCPPCWSLLETMILFSKAYLQARNQLGDLVGIVEEFEVQDSDTHPNQDIPREQYRQGTSVLPKGKSVSLKA